jgi:peptidoglycan/LPS O-acetylase OafA/YrhL
VVAPGDRLVGLDVARCLALLGMVATHVLDERTADGGLTFEQLAGGRASALFAVLAGVTLAAVAQPRGDAFRPTDRRGHSSRLVGASTRPATLAPGQIC